MRRYLLIGMCMLTMATLSLDSSAQKRAGGGKAKSAVKKAQSSVPRANADDVFKKAFEALVGGNQAEAIELFEFGLKSEPGDANGWYFLGVSKLAVNDMDGAIAAIGKGRGMGSPIERARAEQIHDELSELQRALPQYTMREGWIPLLAQALRLYQPPTASKYRIVPETETFNLRADKSFGRLVDCGLSVPAGLETAWQTTLSRENTLWPNLIHVGNGQPKDIGSICSDRKKSTSDTRDTMIALSGVHATIWLGTSEKVASPLLAGSITVSGNPYVLKPGGEWVITTRTNDSVDTSVGRSRLEGDPALLGPLGSTPVYRVDTEFTDVRASSSTTFSSSVRQTGVPFAAAYGIKRDRTFSMRSSDSSGSSSSRSHDTSETVLNKTGALDRPGDILEFAHEIEDSDESRDSSNKRITKTRIERLR